MTPSGAQQIKIFLPTPSARRATVVFSFTQTADNISTHALREEGDAEAVGITVSAIFISTHALREEGDPGVPEMGCRRKRISTHALREEGDLLRYKEPEPDKRFLPTPSARRAT